MQLNILLSAFKCNEEYVRYMYIFEQWQGVERESGAGRARGRGRRAGGAGGQGERVRVAPGAVPRARARPARAPRHLRAQVLQHAPAHGDCLFTVTLQYERSRNIRNGWPH